MIWFFVAYALCGIPFIKPTYRGLLKEISSGVGPPDKGDEVVAVGTALTLTTVWPLLLLIAIVHRWVKADESV